MNTSYSKQRIEKYVMKLVLKLRSALKNENYAFY